MAEYELRRGFAAIDIFCQEKSWAKIFKTSMACEVIRDSSKERFGLKSNTSTFIAIPANARCDISVGVVQIGFGILSHIAKTECYLREGEVQTFIYTPPVTSLSKSVLKKGELHRVLSFIEDDHTFKPSVPQFGQATPLASNLQSALLEASQHPAPRPVQIPEPPLITDVKELKSKNDIVGLGKLLRYNESSIRQESTQALLQLFKECCNFSSKRNELPLVISQFNGVDDNEVLSICLDYLDIQSNRTSPDFLIDKMCEIIGNIKGGFDKLIEYLQNIKSFGSPFHNDVTQYLLGRVANEGASMEALIRIIPYGYCQYSGSAHLIKGYLENVPETIVSKELFDTIRTRQARLGSNVPGSNFCENACRLLSGKLRVASEGWTETN